MDDRRERHEEPHADHELVVNAQAFAGLAARHRTHFRHGRLPLVRRREDFVAIKGEYEATARRLQGNPAMPAAWQIER
jgi:hypothetical protein